MQLDHTLPNQGNELIRETRTNLLCQKSLLKIGHVTVRCSELKSSNLWGIKGLSLPLFCLFTVFRAVWWRRAAEDGHVSWRRDVWWGTETYLNSAVQHSALCTVGHRILGSGEHHVTTCITLYIQFQQMLGLKAHSRRSKWFDFQYLIFKIHVCDTDFCAKVRFFSMVLCSVGAQLMDLI